MTYHKPRRSYPILFVVVVFIFGLLVGCSVNNSNGPAYSDKLADLNQMPGDIQNSPIIVEESYQFAVANPEILKQLPCYCGCGEMGHTSNYSCYVQGDNPDGTIEFDNHALGCSICVDITQDAIRLLEDGQNLPDIRTYIDNTYTSYGPSNIP